MPEQPHDLEALAALAEGRLDAAERQQVMSHVADCRDCRRTLAEIGRAMADGGLQPVRHFRWEGFRQARVWLPVAASVLVGVFAWFQLESWWPRSSDSLPDNAPTLGDDEASSDDLLRKRGAARKVGDKTFRMSGGVWVDTAVDPSTELPSVTAHGSQERAALLAREPQLVPFAELGNRVVVLWQGTVYRFEP